MLNELLDTCVTAAKTTFWERHIVMDSLARNTAEAARLAVTQTLADFVESAEEGNIG